MFLLFFQLENLQDHLQTKAKEVMDLKDELKGVMIDRTYYSESCKIHCKNHEQWMQQYFSKQQEL